MELPQPVLDIMSVMGAAGHRTYVVGGFVRDSLMGRPCADCDLCTDASPDRVTLLLSRRGYRVLPTGVRHGTVTALTDGFSCEITTFRSESGYSDARHPDAVRFHSDLGTDLARRDFTINAMAYSPESGLVDPYGGRGDIRLGLVRAVGDPPARFGEDALRMLRAVRFAARLGFQIEPRTREAIRLAAGGLRHVSAERISSEFMEILLSERPEALAELHALGLLGHILPELLPLFEGPARDEALAAAGLLPPRAELRLACLLAAGVPQAGAALQRLRLPGRVVSAAAALTALAARSPEPDPVSMKLFLRELGRIPYDDHEALGRALLLARGDKNGLETLERCRKTYDMLTVGREPYLREHLALNGRDLIRMGFHGRRVGELLELCLNHIVHNPADNTSQGLTAFIRAADRKM